MLFLKNKHYVFCFNQVSFVIACEMIKNKIQNSEIIITPNRISRDSNCDLNITEYSPIKSLFILVCSVFFKNIEVTIPHPKGGRIIRFITKYSRNLSYIDDGMDTFRDNPKNIELNLVKKGTNYYSFAYNFPVAEWLNGLSVIQVCSVQLLAKDIKPPANVDGFDWLVIESPGVDMNANYESEGNFLFFRHPSYLKNQCAVNLSVSVTGLEYSLEKTLLNFKGVVIVGESMALIFALSCVPTQTRIDLFLSKSQYKNLSTLHEIFSKRVCLHIK